jgi:hypothetical protein
MENFIKNQSIEIANAFTNVATQGYKQMLTFKIDTTKLNADYATEINITEKGDFVEIFEKLMAYSDNPALYYFGINPEIDPNEIIKLIEKTSKERNLITPSKNKNNKNNGILYVGKVKNCAWGRLIQHLGYHQNQKSHGLQIEHWVKNISKPLKLTYNVIFFEKNMADYIEILETALANVYKPIIGKH